MVEQRSVSGYVQMGSTEPRAIRDGLSAVVADSRQLIRAALATFLLHRASIWVVGEAATPIEMLEFVSATSPDFLVLSADLAGAEICELIDHVRSSSPSTYIIVIAEDASRCERMSTTVKVPGHAILHWNTPPRELFDDLRRHTARLVEVRDSSVVANDLTTRELEVLKLAAEGLSNRDIGTRLSISSGTVKRHLANIFERLQAHTRIQAINSAIAAGAIFPRSHR